jgi:RNA polymerase sigma-70 factor (sigma-E family)
MDADAEVAFREFVHASSASLLRTAYLLTHDVGHAEDAVQTTLTRVYLAWPRITRREAVHAYARRTLVREVGSWRRGHRPDVRPYASLPERSEPTSASSFEDRDLLARALRRLSRQQRAVLVLRFYDDLSERDVADALGISVGAVKQHTARALANLRSSLAELSAASTEGDT